MPDPDALAEIPLSLPGMRGRCFGPLAPEVAERLPAWLAGDRADTTTLKLPNVHRSGDLVLKAYPAARGPLSRLRAFPALRTARIYFELLPVLSPKPILAAEPVRGGASLLISAFVPGAVLNDAWRKDPAACAALPRFLALLRRERVLHGDLHPRNLIWDGRTFTLLDVDGVRHRRHLAGRVEASWWALFLIHLGDEEGLRAAHRVYADELGLDEGPAWRRVEARTEVLLGRRSAPPPPGGLGRA